MRYPRMILPALVVAFLGVACGGDGGNGGGDGGDGDSTGSAVTMLDNSFEPTDPSVASGESLSLANQGAATHTFTLEDGSIDETLEAGATSSVTVSLDPGSYPFVCSFHPEMTGNLTVT